MDRIVVIVEYGGGMFDGVAGVKVLKVPKDMDLASLYPRGQGYVTALEGVSADYREPFHATEVASHLASLGAEELSVEWIVIS